MLGVILVALGFLAAVHLATVAFSRALRAYSPSLLEELCERRGHANRADKIADHDERTGRAADLLSVMTGLAMAGLLAVAARRTPDGWLWPTIVVPLLVIGLGRVIVGVLAHALAERLIDRFWPLANGLRLVLDPVNQLLSEAEHRAFERSSRSTPGPRPHSLELEIPQSNNDGDHDGPELELTDATRTLLERAVGLAQRDVEHVMTPRSAVVSIPASSFASEAARAFADSGFSRIPLFAQNRDDIVGILHAKDLYARMLDAPEPSALDLRKLARAPLFVPEIKNAAELLEELRTNRVQMAVVLDEYGGVAGLITLEDLLEELVGEIHDEYDVPEEAEPVKPLGGSRYEVDAALPIEELNQLLGLRLPTDEDFSTVGGLAFSTLGHLPEAGVSFQREGIDFTVIGVEGHSIRRLRLDLQPSSPAAHPF